VVSLSCAHNVPQEKASGPDAKAKGAKSLEFENGEARASGIVTYPGGDRVDWKLVELPEKSKGTLDIKLSWTPPRPGLQLAFDVFDEWNAPVLSSTKKSKKRSKGRTKTAQLDGAKGKYFIRVYASSAATPVATSSPSSSRRRSRACSSMRSSSRSPSRRSSPRCPTRRSRATRRSSIRRTRLQVHLPEFGAPPGWPACKGVCPTPPDINLASCQATMPCPNPPDRRVRACKASSFRSARTSTIPIRRTRTATTRRRLPSPRA